ncbi:Transmembrane protein 44 [Tupaia chinensis]|uniref:Transmembrane protein 44 n=1 Tax=Tupaia chinensis TaxID=246437 RepID=L8XZG6_TUPCH|nr:Transmembrane protein 44 [Tupaia chinensis]
MGKAKNCVQPGWGEGQCQGNREEMVCRGKTFPSIHLWTRFLSALAGLLYASAIVAHDRQPEYLLRATPWFLTSLGRAALDLAMPSDFKNSSFCFPISSCKNPDWVPLTTLSHCKSLRTTAAISRYMELTIEPVQQVIRARVSSSSSSEVSSINSDLEVHGWGLPPVHACCRSEPAGCSSVPALLLTKLALLHSTPAKCS